MPTGLVKSAEESLVAEAAQPDSAESTALNPLAPSARATAFCTWVLKLTENNTRTLTGEEFRELSLAYDHLEGLERLEVRTQLLRHKIEWTTTLECDKDGYDDENNGYEAYNRIQNVGAG